MSKIEYDLHPGDSVQYQEYDGEVIAVNRAEGYITAECYTADGDTFTINMPDHGRRIF